MALVVQLTTEELETLMERAVTRALTARGYALADELLDKDKVAKVLGVSTRTVSTYMARDGLPYAKGLGGRIVFNRDEVLTWARERGFVTKLKVVE